MSHRIRLVPICLIALLPSSRLQAIVITPTRDIHDDAQVINHVQDDPRVGGWRRETEWFRRRLMCWKARDYRTLFGAPIEAHKVDDALMVGEARMLGVSVHNFDPNVNKMHFDGYRVADVGRLVVYFDHDGESPMHVLFYLKPDRDFPKLDDEAKLDKRLAWERPRFARLQQEVDRRWREAIVWEIDVEKEKAASQGLDSADHGVKLQAMLRFGKQQGFTLEFEPSREGEPASWRWFHGGVCLVEATAEATPPPQDPEAELVPEDFVFSRPDGTRLRRIPARPGRRALPGIGRTASQPGGSAATFTTAPGVPWSGAGTTRMGKLSVAKRTPTATEFPRYRARASGSINRPISRSPSTAPGPSTRSSFRITCGFPARSSGASICGEYRNDRPAVSCPGVIVHSLLALCGSERVPQDYRQSDEGPRAQAWRLLRALQSRPLPRIHPGVR